MDGPSARRMSTDVDVRGFRRAGSLPLGRGPQRSFAGLTGVPGIFIIVVTGIAMYIARTLHEAGGRNRAAGWWLVATTGISLGGVAYILSTHGRWAAALTSLGVIAAVLGGNWLAGWRDVRRSVR